VARDLHGAGFRVIGVDDDRTRPGCHSRLVETVRGLSHLPLGLQLVETLLDHADREGGPWLLVPAADDAVQWCITHRDTLVPRLRMSSGLVPERAGVMLDKSLFGQRCRALGIDVPATVQPASMADVQAFARDVGLPCIVKPRAGHLWRKKLRGQKLLTPQDLPELERVMRDIVGDPSGVVLQELVPGPESQLVVGAVWAGEHGRVRHVLTARKIRQFPRNFGSGSLVRTEDLPDVRALSIDIVEKLDYRGLCGTEFKLDARTGRLRLIEINPRPTLWFDLCRAAGTHLVRGHAQELTQVPGAPITAQVDGVTWRYLVRDAIALAQVGPLALARSLWQDRHVDADAVLAFTDPLAGAASFAHAAIQAATHLRRPK
jgi:D-aspartate ligase